MSIFHRIAEGAGALTERIRRVPSVIKRKVITEPREQRERIRVVKHSVQREAREPLKVYTQHGLARKEQLRLKSKGFTTELKTFKGEGEEGRQYEVEIVGELPRLSRHEIREGAKVLKAIDIKVKRMAKEQDDEKQREAYSKAADAWQKEQGKQRKAQVKKEQVRAEELQEERDLKLNREQEERNRFQERIEQYQKRLERLEKKRASTISRRRHEVITKASVPTSAPLPTAPQEPITVAGGEVPKQRKKATGKQQEALTQQREGTTREGAEEAPAKQKKAKAQETVEEAQVQISVSSKDAEKILKETEERIKKSKEGKNLTQRQIKERAKEELDKLQVGGKAKGGKAKAEKAEEAPKETPEKSAKQEKPLSARQMRERGIAEEKEAKEQVKKSKEAGKGKVKGQDEAERRIKEEAEKIRKSKEGKNLSERQIRERAKEKAEEGTAEVEKPEKKGKKAEVKEEKPTPKKKGKGEVEGRIKEEADKIRKSKEGKKLSERQIRERAKEKVDAEKGEETKPEEKPLTDRQKKERQKAEENIKQKEVEEQKQPTVATEQVAPWTTDKKKWSPAQKKAFNEFLADPDRAFIAATKGKIGLAQEAVKELKKKGGLTKAQIKGWEKEEARQKKEQADKAQARKEEKAKTDTGAKGKEESKKPVGKQKAKSEQRKKQIKEGEEKLKEEGAGKTGTLLENNAPEKKGKKKTPKKEQPAPTQQGGTISIENNVYMRMPIKRVEEDADKGVALAKEALALRAEEGKEEQPAPENKGKKTAKTEVESLAKDIKKAHPELTSKEAMKRAKYSLSLENEGKKTEAKEEAPAPKKKGKEKANKTAKKEKDYQPWELKAQEYSDWEAGVLGEQKKPASQQEIEYHKGKVRDAIAEGKKVPPAVLAEYPDLSEKATPKQTRRNPKAEAKKEETVDAVTGETPTQKAERIRKAPTFVENQFIGIPISVVLDRAKEGSEKAQEAYYYRTGVRISGWSEKKVEAKEPAEKEEVKKNQVAKQ